VILSGIEIVFNKEISRLKKLKLQIKLKNLKILKIKDEKGRKT